MSCSLSLSLAYLLAIALSLCAIVMLARIWQLKQIRAELYGNKVSVCILLVVDVQRVGEGRAAWDQ